MRGGYWIFCGFFCRAKGREGRRSGLNLRGGKGSTRSLDAIRSWRPNQHPQRRGRQAGEHQYSEVPLFIAGSGAVGSMRHLIFRKSCMDTWTAQLWFADFMILWLYWSQRCGVEQWQLVRWIKFLDFFQSCVILMSRREFCTHFAHRLNTKGGRFPGFRHLQRIIQNNKGSVENQGVSAATSLIWA